MSNRQRKRNELQLRNEFQHLVIISIVFKKSVTSVLERNKFDGKQLLQSLCHLGKRGYQLSRIFKLNIKIIYLILGLTFYSEFRSKLTVNLKCQAY